MAFKRIFPLLTVSLLALTSTLHASTVLVSTSGQFDSIADPATQLWASNAKWSLSFDVNNIPVQSNTTTLGFDAGFSHFTYTLNGANVAVSPSFINFSTTGNGGLFTLFFGPESGFMNGVPVPEFVFYGTQAFTGTTTSPSFAPGSFGVSEWTYSDSTTYDDKTSPASTVTLAAVPEPSTALFFALPLLALAPARVRRFISLT